MKVYRPTRIQKLMAALTAAALLLTGLGTVQAAPPAGPLVSPPAALTDSLVAYWKLDETSGNRADVVGGNTLTDNNTVPSVTGVVVNAADFNGSNEYLSHVDNAALSVGDQDYSFTAWFKLDSLPPAGKNDSIFGKRQAGSSEYELFVTSAGGLNWSYRNFADTAYPTYGITATIATGQWYFFAVTYHAATDTIVLRLNETYSTTSTSAPGVHDSINSFYIAYRPDSGIGDQWLDGKVDEVGLWKRTLTADEVTTLYQDGSGCAYSFTTCTTSTPGVTLLQDGNMEDNPNLYWEQLYNPIESGVHERRLFPGTNFFTNLLYGGAACGSGMQMLGYTSDFLSSYRLNPIGQEFTWSGGTVKLRYSVRGRGRQDSPGLTPTAPRLKVYIESEDGTTIYPLTVVDASTTWANYTDSLAGLAAGTYRLVFDMYGEDADRNAQLFIDDVALGAGTQSSACAAPSATATPNLTRTPTPTRTPTITPTTGPFAISNCGFESGTVGWNFYGSSRIGPSGGPSGAAYAIADPDITQRFTWTGGLLYLQLFVRGPVEVVIGEGILGANPTTLIDANYPTWTLVQRTVYRASGTNRLLLSRGTSNSSATADFDGVQLSGGGYVAQICSAPTSTPTTAPTGGPTATPNATRTPGPSPSVSTTPRGTSTPNPSMTPQKTYTPRPSSTPRTTSTQTDPEKTSTAQGTPVATYTPYPTSTPGGGGGGGGGTCDVNVEDCPVPPQPVPGPYAECQRPIYFWEVAQWIDYTRCSVLTYFAWSDENSEQLVGLGAEVNDHEPFGTVAEVVDGVAAVQYTMAEYDWVDTGYTGAFSAERPELLSLSLSALANPVDFAIDAGQFAVIQLEVTFCQGRLGTVFSSNVAQGVCTVWAFLHGSGIIAWIQFFLDLASWLILIRYIWKRFLA